MTVPRSLSFVDIAKIPNGIAIMQRNCKKEIDNLLFQYGFDIEYGWELIECNHRPITSNQPVFGYRVEGIERSDNLWLAGGFASLEVKIESCDDLSLRDALLEISKTGSSDKTFKDEMTAKSVLKNQSKI